MEWEVFWLGGLVCDEFCVELSPCDRTIVGMYTRKIPGKRYPPWSMLVSRQGFKASFLMFGAL